MAPQPDKHIDKAVSLVRCALGTTLRRALYGDASALVRCGDLSHGACRRDTVEAAPVDLTSLSAAQLAELQVRIAQQLQAASL